MAVTPKGMSVQEAYRQYRDGALLVNRKYQRKLVWTIGEKARLIDSMLQGFPIPLILLAAVTDFAGKGKLEIVDGMQRLNAAFSFIENQFAVDDKYFDLDQFPRAKQASETGDFEPADNSARRLEQAKCLDLLDYNFAVTIFPANEETEVTEVFGRINSNGKLLSPQERRQAGVLTPLAQLVRVLAAEIRGDVSPAVLNLAQMPEISIDTRKAKLGYGVTAEETFWCKQGVLSAKQLRDSEDEQLLADVLASVLLNEPLAASQEVFDELYDDESELYQKVAGQLAMHGGDRLRQEVKNVFSILEDLLEKSDSGPTTLKTAVGGTATKTPFFAVFMALYDLIVREAKSPDRPEKVVHNLAGIATKLRSARHYADTEDRKRNIAVAKGLMDVHFVKKEPPVLGHGPSLTIDFENALRRSRIETARYEFKQGFLRLSDDRQFDNQFAERLAEIACGIANIGPEADGYIFIGVADKQADADRIAKLDGITPRDVAGIKVVGVDREAKLSGKTMEAYLKEVLGIIQKSALSEPLKSQILSNLDAIGYRGLCVLRLRIPRQNVISFVGAKAFVRTGSDTHPLEGQALLAQNQMFAAKSAK